MTFEKFVVALPPDILYQILKNNEWNNWCWLFYSNQQIRRGMVKKFKAPKIWDAIREEKKSTMTEYILSVTRLGITEISEKTLKGNFIFAFLFGDMHYSKTIQVWFQLKKIFKTLSLHVDRTFLNVLLNNVQDFSSMTTLMVRQALIVAICTDDATLMRRLLTAQGFKNINLKPEQIGNKYQLPFLHMLAAGCDEEMLSMFFTEKTPKSLIEHSGVMLEEKQIFSDQMKGTGELFSVIQVASLAGNELGVTYLFNTFPALKLQHTSVRFMSVNLEFYPKSRKCISCVAESGNLSLLRFFHEQYEIELDLSVHDDRLGKTVLHYAARSGNVKMLEYLKEKQIKAKFDNAGESPLHEAARYGRVAAFIFLADKEVGYGLSPVRYGEDNTLYDCIIEGSAIELIRHLFFHEGKIQLELLRENWYFLWKSAIRQNALDTLDYLLSLQKKYQNFLPIFSLEGIHALFVQAIEKETTSVLLLRFLVEKFGFDPLKEARDQQGYTYFHYACSQLRFSWIQYMIAGLHINPLLSTASGESPLKIAQKALNCRGFFRVRDMTVTQYLRSPPGGLEKLIVELIDIFSPRHFSPHRAERKRICAALTTAEKIASVTQVLAVVESYRAEKPSQTRQLAMDLIETHSKNAAQNARSFFR